MAKKRPFLTSCILPPSRGDWYIATITGVAVITLTGSGKRSLIARTSIAHPSALLTVSPRIIAVTTGRSDPIRWFLAPRLVR